MDASDEQTLNRIREIERRLREMETLLNARLEKIEEELKRSVWK